jgi:hypothetical protein
MEWFPLEEEEEEDLFFCWISARDRLTGVGFPERERESCWSLFEEIPGPGPGPEDVAVAAVAVTGEVMEHLVIMEMRSTDDISCDADGEEEERFFSCFWSEFSILCRLVRPEAPVLTLIWFCFVVGMRYVLFSFFTGLLWLASVGSWGSWSAKGLAAGGAGAAGAGGGRRGSSDDCGSEPQEWIGSRASFDRIAMAVAAVAAGGVGVGRDFNGVWWGPTMLSRP